MADDNYIHDSFGVCRDDEKEAIKVVNVIDWLLG